MVDMSNAWPNHYVAILWLVVFVLFVVGKYPHDKGDGHK